MFLERNEFVMTLLLFIQFVSASIFKWHFLFMYYIYGIKESNASQENLRYIIWYLKRNNCVCETLFILGLLFQRIITTSWIPSINLCYSSFSHVYLLDDISLYLNFQWVHSVVERPWYYIHLLNYMCNYFKLVFGV